MNFASRKEKLHIPLFLSALTVVVFCLGLRLTPTVFGQADANINTNAALADNAVNPDQAGIVADPVADLNTQIEAKKKRIAELQQQATEYQQALSQASGQVKDLQSQVRLIENQLALTNIEIATKAEEISSLELEMQSIQNEIDAKLKIIETNKISLQDTIKKLDQQSRTPLLALIVLNQRLSEFYGQLQAYASISDSLQDNVLTIRRAKDELQSKQDQLTQARDEVKISKLQLLVKNQEVDEQKELKDGLLSNAQSTQAKYDNLLETSLREEQQAGATISALERQLQARLDSGNVNAPVFLSKGYIWPVGGDHKISAYFHDPDYPYRCSRFKSRYCFEHAGIDLPVSSGTPVRATADGVVSIAVSTGSKDLNYVGLVHQNGISSRYLHLSQVLVQADQFIKQGEIIGLSGGVPYSVGSGPFTTGAHLHLEIRVDGLPDDPLKYLP